MSRRSVTEEQHRTGTHRHRRAHARRAVHRRRSRGWSSSTAPRAVAGYGSKFASALATSAASSAVVAARRRASAPWCVLPPPATTSKSTSTSPTEPLARLAAMPTDDAPVRSAASAAPMVCAAICTSTCITDRTERLAVGARAAGRRKWLTVEAARPAGTRWLVHFAGLADRTAAEAFVNTPLLAEPLPALSDDGLYVQRPHRCRGGRHRPAVVRSLRGRGGQPGARPAGTGGRRPRAGRVHRGDGARCRRPSIHPKACSISRVIERTPQPRRVGRSVRAYVTVMSREPGQLCA